MASSLGSILHRTRRATPTRMTQLLELWTECKLPELVVYQDCNQGGEFLRYLFHFDGKDHRTSSERNDDRIVPFLDLQTNKKKSGTITVCHHTKFFYEVLDTDFMGYEFKMKEHQEFIQT